MCWKSHEFICRIQHFFLLFFCLKESCCYLALGPSTFRLLMVPDDVSHSFTENAWKTYILFKLNPWEFTCWWGSILRFVWIRFFGVINDPICRPADALLALFHSTQQSEQWGTIFLLQFRVGKCFRNPVIIMTSSFFLRESKWPSRNSWRLRFRYVVYDTSARVQRGREGGAARSLWCGR